MRFMRYLLFPGKRQSGPGLLLRKWTKLTSQLPMQFFDQARFEICQKPPIISGCLPCHAVCARLDLVLENSSQRANANWTTVTLGLNGNRGLPTMAHVASLPHIHTKVREVIGRMTFAVLALLQLAAIPISEARAAEVKFSDFPLPCSV